VGQGPPYDFARAQKSEKSWGFAGKAPPRESRGPGKENKMMCHICGGKLEKVVTNLPFKVSHASIVIVKRLPVSQCVNCSEYVIEDEVMRKVDDILNRIDATAELEVLNYAV
jgi:YgiT-type zinc finger domain-containing protein